jgi:hypothetical protein
MTCRAAGFGVLFLGLSGAGCGEVTSSPSSEHQAPPIETMTGSAYAGGTRLRAVLAEASDGTASFFHWWDVDLGVQCQFQAVDEPETGFRCRPASGPVIYEGMDEAFGDPECSEPLVSEAALPAGGPRVVRRLAVQCYSAEYFRVGARFTGAIVYRKTDAGCQPGDQAAQVLPALFTLEALPDSAFVAAHDAAVPTAAGVAAEQLVADDGSRAPHGFRDGAGGFRCWPRRTASGIRCLPDDFGWGDRGGYYSDAGCRVAAAVTAMGCGDGRAAVPYVFSEEGGLVGGVTTVRRGGARLPQVFQQVGAGECAAGFRDTVAFAIGDPMDLGSFAPASFSQATRPSGLVQTVAEVDGVTVASFAELSASALGGYDCALAATPDGAVHCVPPIGYTQREYADPACTEAVWQSDFEHISVAAPPTEFAADTPASVDLPAIERVLADGTPYDGPVYAESGAGCTRVEGVPNTRRPYHRFSREAPLSELPMLSIVVR